MWIILMLIMAVVAYLSLASLLQQHMPDMAHYLPTPAISKPAAATASPFDWKGYERPEMDGSRTLELAANAERPAGSQVSLYLTCYHKAAYLYLAPVGTDQLQAVTLNGRTVETRSDTANHRLFILNPLPEAIAKELPSVYSLETTLHYRTPSGDTESASLFFRTTGFGIYLPYFERDCDEGLSIKQHN